MPANLNALIRYKTINDCLSGGRRRCTIFELMDACSDALEEYRGRKENISERTIRDDLRVMRSEILGFNAPIKCEDGDYFYSDPDYTLASIFISDAGLAREIREMLKDIRQKVSHPEIDNVLEKLNRVIRRAGRKPGFRDTETFERLEHSFPGTISFEIRRTPEPLPDATLDEVLRLLSDKKK